jgi:hypothetical protein
MEPTDVVYEITRHFIADTADTFGESLKEKLLGYVRSRSISSLASASSLFDPDYHGHLVLKGLLQVEAFFKKCDLFSDEKCSEVAFAAFLESEEICRVTNERLDKHYELEPSDWFRGMVERVEQEIAHTLGPIGPFFGELPHLIRITNGATAAHPRSKSGGVDRIKRTMYATRRSHPYLKALSTFWGYSFNFRKIHHNRVELVPKNWKTHRTIACEPEGNIALQLAFDEYCKRKLRRRLNIDLSDQSRNQRLALESSVHGKLCTVDLKAASDRLSLNVVHLLFPREWVDFFLDTRSPCWKTSDGVLKPYHKLSSMGNGYTFTVETLVFAAVCKAIGSEEFSVYGDDIIVETELLEPLVDALNYLGFEVNQEKSHASYPSSLLSRENLLPTARLVPLGLERFTGRMPDDVPSSEGDHLRSDGYGAPKRVDDDGFAQWLSNVVEVSLKHQESKRLYGCYRESCGVHAFGGQLITPLFISSLRTRRDWVLLMNNIISLGATGGNLWEYAHRLVCELNLPLGPPVLDAGACVFIDVYDCYRLGLIRSFPEGKGFGPWQPAFRALIPKSTVRRCHDSRALFLWFTNRRKTPYESSRHSLGTSKVRSKWV